MNRKPLVLRALWSALGVTAYIGLLTIFFAYANRMFDQEDKVTTPLAFLLLFVFSALLTGSLVLLAPIRLYLDGQKSEGVQLLLYTAMWLGILTILAMISLAMS